MKTFEEAFKVLEAKGNLLVRENVKAGIISSQSESYNETLTEITHALFQQIGFLAVPMDVFQKICGTVDSMIQIGVLIGIEMEKPDEREGGLQAMWEKDSGPRETPKEKPDL